MSVVAPVRAIEAIPYAESQPQRQLRHASPEWLPVIGWFVDDGRRHSRINVVPLGKFEGLVEITARSLDNPPDHFPWVDSWLEFAADDGSLSGSVPGFVFKGGTTKRVMSGKWQHWPGVAAHAAFASSVLLLNYHPRPTSVRLDLLAPSGRSLSSETLTIDARMPRTFDLEATVLGARDLLAAEGGFGSLRIWSAYKLPGFILMRNRSTGVITSFDHTVPFAGPPID